ncbi:MAG TPA: protoporphyrinogen oxidase [Cytophagaceae bacterium]|jgi:oxygen-dependent protoporphyrinogen oxidase
MICIIGGGISGLTTAFYLQKAGLEYCVLEAGSRPGGYITTYKDKDYILEEGPNSLLMDEATFEFIKEIGLESEIEFAKPVNKKRYIFKNGYYQALPSNPISLVGSNFFSWTTKFKIFRDLFGSSKATKSESTNKALTLHDFFLEKFGEEVVEYALQPFIAGIYSGDPKKILTHLTFPSLLEYENKYGSLIRGLVKNAGARKRSITFKNGMQSLPEAIAQGLNIKYRTCVEDISHEDGRYLISTNQGSVIADRLVIATTAHTASNYLKNLLPEISTLLSSIHYPPMLVVHSIYKTTQVTKKLEGFGGLNPAKENLFTAGSIFSSTIFNDRCPNDEVLFTTFIGGSLFEEAVLLKDTAVLTSVHKELSQNFVIEGSPLLQKIFRWDKAIPQYDVNLDKLTTAIEKQESKNLYVCANWYKGVSLGDCIKKGRATAENIYVHSPK